MADGTLSGAALAKVVRDATERALHDAGSDLLGRAVPLTPMEQSDLRESLHLDPPMGASRTPTDPTLDLEVLAIANTAYAAAQHEGAPHGNPRWAHLSELTYTQPGTGPKFLERPLKEMEPRYEAFVAARVRAAVEAAGG